jgi:hypothetical protein
MGSVSEASREVKMEKFVWCGRNDYINLDHVQMIECYWEAGEPCVLVGFVKYGNEYGETNNLKFGRALYEELLRRKIVKPLAYGGREGGGG